jgi:hypothetical protein
MSTALLRVLGVVGALAMANGPLAAQEPPPTPDDLTLRPGDTIATVENLLDITPKLTPD